MPNTSHQFGLAQLQYAEDYNGRFTPGDYSFGGTILSTALPLSPGVRNLGHLLEGDYIPLPESDTHVMWCPGLPNFWNTTSWVELFKVCWEERYTTVGPYNHCNINYEFRASLDGYHKANLPGGGPIRKGVFAERVHRYPILMDWNQGLPGGSRQSLHKSGNDGGSKYNILFGDGSVQLLDDRDGLIIREPYSRNDPPVSPYPGTTSGRGDSQYFAWIDEYFGLSIYQVPD